MDQEFHYYITGLIAKKAGFNKEETSIIAYSSEFVDENDICFEILDRKTNEVYRNFISQTMNILKPKNELIRIYSIFHFIPGEPDAYSARRRDGKMHILNTTPDSYNANMLIENAFKAPEETRLYRIGIASHSYVDSWAHQNFVGWYDDFNAIGMDFKPNIGHADAEHHPDMIGHKWIDKRLVNAEINNINIFLSAAKHLFLKYCEYLKSQKREDNSELWDELEKDLIDIQLPAYTGDKKRYEDKRIKKYKELIDLDDFDDHKWFNQAIDTEIHGGKDSHNGIKNKLILFRDKYFWKQDILKEKTHWYNFQRAVKAHEKFGIKLLSNTFKKMGFDLSNT